MPEALVKLWNTVRYLKLLYPLLLVGALAGALRLPARRGRTFVVLALSGLLALSWLPVSWLNHYFLEGPYRNVLPEPEVDAIIVLSGSAARPMERYPYGLLLDSSIRRTRYAAFLAQGRPDTPVMACGPGFASAPAAPSIAREMGELLVGWGIERDRIWYEEAGVSTASQSAAAAEILRARGVRSVLVVTDAVHMRRAVGCFRRLGFEAYAGPSEVHSRVAAPSLSDLLPSPYLVLRSEEALREWVALAVYKLRGVI